MTSSRQCVTAYERAARITYLLMIGMGLTTREVAREVGLSRQGALELLYDLARMLPVAQDDQQIWRKIDPL